MPLSPRHWRARHLFGAWITYWAALLAVVLGPAALALWRIRNAGPNTSNASFSFGDKGLEAQVSSLGATLWSGSVSAGTAILALVGPPLLLWLLWVALRPRGRDAAPDARRMAHPGDAAGALPGAPVEDPLVHPRHGTRERR